jgi:uncharacterized membrane protein
LSSRYIYLPLTLFFFLLLTFVFAGVFSLVFIGAVGRAFHRVFGSWTISLLLFLSSLLGSSVNIPIGSMKARRPRYRMGIVQVFGVSYPVPVIEKAEDRTYIAVNLGGAIIPTIAALFLLYRIPQIRTQALIATLVVSLLVWRVARLVQGVGIVTPALFPPLITAVTALFLGGGYVYAVAYISGTLGTLIGADILNLRKIPTLGASVISIGGAGTFDGIFLTGILAVLLA